MPKDPEGESYVAGKVKDLSWTKSLSTETLCALQILLVPYSPHAFVSLGVWKASSKLSRSNTGVIHFAYCDAVG